MKNYYRAVDLDGQTIVIETDNVESVRDEYMWVDPAPLDLAPAQYTDTKLVKLGDLVCCGGDEFRVSYIRPCMDGFLFGRIKAETGAWYSVEYAVLLSRKDG